MGYNKVLHERVILLAVKTEKVPRVRPARRAQVTSFGQSFYQVVLHFGIMEETDVPAGLERLRLEGERLKLDEINYFIGRETVLATKQPGIALWREKLFAFLSRNSQNASAFFRLPPSQVIEIETQVEL